MSGRKCSGVVELRSLGSVRPCADSVRPLSCILARRACSFGFASLRNFGQALSRILAFAVVWVGASLRRQPFVPLHLCIDSHLCRCIVQRLCVAVFMHPCITALCGCLYASLHNDFGRPPSCILCTFMNALLVSHHCETLGKHYHASLRLRSLGRRVLAPTLCDRHLASLHVYERSVGFASLRNFGRSFYKASMPYPQVAGSPTHQHTKGVTPLIEWGYTFWCRWRGSNPHGIATNGF